MEGGNNHKKAQHRDNLQGQPKQPKPVQIAVSALGHHVEVNSNATPQMTIKALTMAINAIVAKHEFKERSPIEEVPSIVPMGRL